MRCAACDHDAEDVCLPEDEETANKQFSNYKRLLDARVAITDEIDEIENGSDDLGAAHHYRLGDLYEELNELDDQLNELSGPCSLLLGDIDDEYLDFSDGWIDVSHLESLVYRFAGIEDDAEVIVDMPHMLWVADNGDHFIVDTEGVGVIVTGTDSRLEITAYPLAGNVPFPNGPLW